MLTGRGPGKVERTPAPPPDYPTLHGRSRQLVCQLTGCVNAFSAIKVSGQRLAIHEHGRSKRISSTQVIDFDSAFFAGREVVVFDDILTQGKSYAQFACALEAIGASVIGGLFLGRTMYC